ncbi:hypothetical protein GIB67_027484 [Kingdonia uniflora]|uniref:Leucine-rich repeat-containing N-terminal plant-type domain-containing protein n=1 Tax=Kingdonia uniflora TaxID=39325 RepID=A0A7J7MFI6_9MAGN|nr:hypothetical protein GIB67_027484 [Kingdonia uniflora]
MFCLFLSGSTGFGTPNDIYCLRTFKDSVQDPLGKLTSSWSFNNSTEGSICSYVGIECWNKNESMVLNIGLTGMGLQGQFPKGLENCTSITGLDLSNNELSGSIPSDISKILPFLTYLNLSSNKFSAEIPRGLLNLSFLNALDLANNRFTGHIPASSSSSGWSRLKKLDLSLNMLSGQIPDNLSWYSLASLNLSFNNIEGEVSQVACSVESPRGRMYIRDVMKELIVIRKVFLGVGIHGNSDWYCLRTLKVSLQDPFNLLESWNFKGDGLCNFMGISCFGPSENRVLGIRLEYMGLKGQFPKGLENCTSLTALYLSNNEISGSIP